MLCGHLSKKRYNYTRNVVSYSGSRVHLSSPNKAVQPRLDATAFAWDVLWPSITVVGVWTNDLAAPLTWKLLELLEMLEHPFIGHSCDEDGYALSLVSSAVETADHVLKASLAR